jgi:hypothetical protein
LKKTLQNFILQRQEYIGIANNAQRNKVRKIVKRIVKILKYIMKKIKKENMLKQKHGDKPIKKK